jgi:DNA topoisomerase IB
MALVEDGTVDIAVVHDRGDSFFHYHDDWRKERDEHKYDHVLEFGTALPRIREDIAARLAGRGLTRDRVLAAALRLVDLGFFRAGGEEYEAEHGTFGLATIRREHVTCRRGGGHDVTADDLNEYLREISGGDFTVKDFRTWNATVLAAVGLAVSRNVSSDHARRRAVARVVREVADYLGNTAAVARSSYIDPAPSAAPAVRLEGGVAPGAPAEERALAELGPAAVSLAILRDVGRAGADRVQAWHD